MELDYKKFESIDGERVCCEIVKGKGSGGSYNDLRRKRGVEGKRGNKGNKKEKSEIREIWGK